MGAVLDVQVWQHASALDPAANRAALDRITPDAGVDLVVLPEAFARDFGEPGEPLAPYAEPLDGPFVRALQDASRRSGATVVGGMFETSADPDRPYNTLVVAQGDELATYRKIHLYDSFGQRESDIVTPGPLEPTVVEVAGARVGLMTCYDLRFPELARMLSATGTDVLVVPAAWVAGAGKAEQWRTLLRARAIENLCWVVAAGQPAPRYTGYSAVISPTGDVVVEAGEGAERISATLDLDAVAIAREKNPSLLNRRL